MNVAASWDVLAFQSDAHESDLRDACAQVGAKLHDYNVSPSFRYVVLASREQMHRVVALVPWIKHYHASEMRNVECALIETAGDDEARPDGK